MLYLFCQVSDLKSAFAKSLLRARTATPVFSKSRLCQPDIAFTLQLAEDTSAVSICQLVNGKLKAEKGLLLLLFLGHEQTTALLFSCNQYRQATIWGLLFYQGVPLHWWTLALNQCIRDYNQQTHMFYRQKCDWACVFPAKSLRAGLNDWWVTACR